MTKSKVGSACFLSLALGVASAWGDDPSCFYGCEVLDTGAFSFSAESVTGVPGDVVPVTFTLTSQVECPGWGSATMAVCHDLSLARIEGNPVISDELVSILGVGGATLDPITEQWQNECQTGAGFYLTVHLDPDAYRARFPSETPLTVMTVYYRIVGNPGESTALSFCDDVLRLRGIPCAPGACLHNSFHMYTADDTAGWDEVSRLHRHGQITIVEGEVTRPERPPDPPEAIIYPARPTDEEVNFRVRVEGSAGHVGDTRVPVEVFVAADVEYTAVELGINFDERYLRLTEAQDHFLFGSALVDNRDELPGESADEGHAIIFSGFALNSRRLAPARAEFHAATLYFEILDSAAGIRETPLTVEPVVDHRGLRYPNWLHVRYNGSTGDEFDLRAEVAPIAIENSKLYVLPDGPTQRGDVNYDGELNIADAVAMLSYLFARGPKLLVPVAGDVNEDGEIDIADPIRLLSDLF